jgi:CBS domain-containing protein
MAKTLKRPAPPRLSLRAATARELMVENPISVRRDATVREALALMIDRGFSVAPVVDESGRAVGVVSVSDILIHNRENGGAFPPDDGLFDALRRYAGPLRTGETTDVRDPTTVESIMTPAVLAVRQDTSAAEVVRRLVAHRVHHLFVADDDGTVVGVIGTGDIVRNLT